MSLLSGVAVVIGAGAGDGRAVSHLIIKSGCTKLVLGDVSESRLAAVENECAALGREAGRDRTIQILSKKCDTMVPEEVEDFFAAAVAKFGRIDYCANCERPSGGFESKTLDTPGSTFSTVLEDWQRRVWLSMRAEVRQFLAQQKDDSRQQRPGSTATTSIVNVSAAHGLASDPGFAGYCGAAHGIIGMTRATAIDYLQDSIRINSVCPGASVDVGSERDGGKAQPGSLPLSPLGRGITPEEVAQAVVFLLGEGASAITGISLPVDGGWGLKHH